jgi:hypothetical protein
MTASAHMAEETNFVPTITLTRAMAEPALFSKVFASPSFWTWRVVAKLIDNISLTEPREIELFERCTGRTYNRQARKAARRLFLSIGRRGGKDRFLSAVGVWRAALCADWRKYQSAGEGAVVLLLGRDKKQAAILRRYCRGLLQVPALAAEVARDTGEVIEFRNGASLEIASNDVSLVRGRSAIAVLGSEVAHWKSAEHAASNDEEVVSAAEASMAMCPDAGLLLLGSSVFRKRGYLYRKYRELFGNNDADAEDVCWFAPSPVMNSKLPQHVIEKALAEDAKKAGAEYLNIWREDLSDFIPFDVIEGCTDKGIYHRIYDPNFSYSAFTDAAGGTGGDSFTLAIAHRLYDGTVFIDVLRERKPRFIPRDVVAEYAQLLKSFNISEVCGDGFAGGFHSSEWERNGITFVACERTTAENYLASLPMMLAPGRVRLIDNATLRAQLASLERVISPTDRETVRHPQTANAHDDLATSVCGALSMSSRPTYDRQYLAWRDPPKKPAVAPAFKPVPQANGDWWRSQERTPTYSSTTDADSRLKDLYKGIESAVQWGVPNNGRRFP